MNKHGHFTQVRTVYHCEEIVMDQHRANVNDGLLGVQS